MHRCASDEDETPLCCCSVMFAECVMSLQASKRVAEANPDAASAVPQWLKDIEQKAKLDDERIQQRAEASATEAQASLTQPATGVRFHPVPLCPAVPTMSKQWRLYCNDGEAATDISSQCP